MEGIEKQTVQQQLWDIIVEVSWGEISEQYFKKSRSWLSKKMNGKGFNGGEGGFSSDEIEKLNPQNKVVILLYICNLKMKYYGTKFNS